MELYTQLMVTEERLGEEVVRLKVGDRGDAVHDCSWMRFLQVYMCGQVSHLLATKSYSSVDLVTTIHASNVCTIIIR